MISARSSGDTLNTTQVGEIQEQISSLIHKLRNSAPSSEPTRCRAPVGTQHAWSEGMTKQLPSMVTVKTPEIAWTNWFQGCAWLAKQCRGGIDSTRTIRG